MAENEPLSYRSNQAEDTPFTLLPISRGQVGYLYSRSFDSFQNSVEGQDYFALQEGENNFCFVLCDGVGQSYCGQLAAKFLGDQVLDWLKKLDAIQPEETNLASQLTDEINAIRDQAQNMVLAHELPANTPDLLLIALTEQKNYGSEAVFVAGRIDFGRGHNLPTINLFWLGDTRMHFLDKNGVEAVEPGGRWVYSERWSTKHGIKGTETVHHWFGKLDRIRKIIVHSDGMKLGPSDYLHILVNHSDEMNSVVEKLRAQPDSDDVSLIVLDLAATSKKVDVIFAKVKTWLVNLKQYFKNFIDKIKILMVGSYHWIKNLLNKIKNLIAGLLHRLNNLIGKFAGRLRD